MTTKEKEIIEKSIFEEDMATHFEILKLLNSLYKISYKEYYTELIVKHDKRAIIFQKVKNKLNHLEKLALANEENAEPLYAIATFKVLFMKENEFNISEFKEKKKYFDLILSLLSNKELIGEELSDIEKLTEKILNSEFKELTLKINAEEDKNLILSFCFYVIHKYSKSKIILTNLFIFFMKSQFKFLNNTDLEIINDFSEKDVQKIEIKDLLKDFVRIYEKIENFIIIHIDKGHLKIERMPIDKINQIINENEENENNEKKQKKSQIIKQNIKEKDEKPKNQINLEKGNNQISQEPEKQPNEKDSQMPGFESSENNIIQSSDISDELRKMEEKHKKEMEDLKMYFMKEFEKQKKININLEEEVSKLKKNQKNMKVNQEEEVRNLKKKITSINKNYKKIKIMLDNTQSELEEITDKCTDYDYEIGLIKLRDPIKNIIDIFGNTLQVPLDLSYYQKTEKIKQKLGKKITKV